ncbi:MAG: hypothetical protein GXY85_01820 [Candidatus Brocadiaceae bacterium]|nr:hypothetical protein [Candidatus Brocadiaceae bacterium]
MTWRAFFLGLFLAGLLNWSDVYCGWAHIWGRMTESNFPVSCVFALVVLTLVVNVVIKFVRRGWAFRQAELMLVWIMLLVASSIPTTGLQRFWLPMLAGPPYLAGRSDIIWRETALNAVADDLVVSKDPLSVAARRFYEGGGSEARVPWHAWRTPLLSWGVFWLIFFTAVLFMCILLRKQWVDQERLQFPLARVPLEFSEGADGEGWLPIIFGNQAFVLGFAGATVFRLIRAVPLLVGGTVWSPKLPLQTTFAGTALEAARFVDVPMSWIALGFAFLVPVDVSMSIWFIYLFTRAELVVSAQVGSTISPSNLLSWQMGGAYVALTIGALFMCRRHFADVLRRAFGRGRETDDSREVLPLGWAFWGLLLCSALVVAWLRVFQMRLPTAIAWFAVLMCIQFVHARLVAQSGVPDPWLAWDPTDLVYGITGGTAFGPPGAVLAHMQRRMMYSIPHGPAMMHSVRISEVFPKKRALLLPIIVLVLIVSLTISSWTYLDQAYKVGVVNFNDAAWSGIGNVRTAFDLAHTKIVGRGTGRLFYTGPFVAGILLTSFVMFMRARFYWWPLHPIGLLTCQGWNPDRIWLPFLIGWFIKVAVSRFAGGRMLRQGRLFFIGVIMSEAAVSGVSTVLGSFTRGAVPGF